MGRPSEYTPERGEAILARLAVGDTLRQICLEAGMPDPATVYRWLERDLDFREQYARAREVQAEVFVDEMVDVARASTPETAAADRVRTDAIKWVAGKRKPKVYGDKVALEHSTPPGQPMQVEHAVEAESLAQLAGIIGELTGSEAPRSGESPSVASPDQSGVPGTSRGDSTSSAGGAT